MISFSMLSITLSVEVRQMIIDQAPCNHSFRNFLNPEVNYSMHAKPLTENEILKYCSAITTQAVGYDDISPGILKLSIQFISKPLTYLVNQSFKSGSFPEELKTAKVIAIHKSGSKNEIKNKRPISILNVISKIYEKAMHSRLNSFLESHNLIIANQHGFRHNHSTESAILNFTKHIYEALNNHKYAIGVFLDFSKAFECIEHDILIAKLENIGIRGNFLGLISDYLKNRKQAVYYQGEFSDFKYLKYGVPQGSILGPLLFNIYVNDVTNASNLLNITLYADDKNCGMADENPYALITNVNVELELLFKWITCNHLILNFLKNVFILFSRSVFYGPLPPLLIGNQFISRVYETKFLGVMIDYRLSWESHINYLSTKLSKICGITYVTRKQLTQSALINIYYTLFYSLISYCITIWGGTACKHINRIYMIQKRFMRAITYSKKYQRTTPIFNSLRILKFHNIYKIFLYILSFKYFRQNYCVENFEVNQNLYRTRRADVLLKIPNTSCAAGSRSAHYLLPCKWNELVNSPHGHIVTQSNTLPTFKKSIKTILLTEQL